MNNLLCSYIFIYAHIFHFLPRFVARRIVHKGLMISCDADTLHGNLLEKMCVCVFFAPNYQKNHDHR